MKKASASNTCLLLTKTNNKGIRKGKSGFPKFKSKKDNHQSYREPNVNGNCKVLFMRIVCS